MDTPREQLRAEITRMLLTIKAQMFELHERQIGLQNQLNVLDSLDKMESATKSNIETETGSD